MLCRIDGGRCAVFTLAGLSALGLTVPVGAAPSGGIRVEVSGFDSAEGTARCGLFVQEGWGDEKSMVSGAEAVIEQGRAVCRFAAVSPGRYGVIVYHDKNGNQRFDRNFLGIPTEDYCFSENAQGGLGVPDFRKASFVVDAGEERTGCKL